MSLSQDEINALLTTDQADEENEVETPPPQDVESEPDESATAQTDDDDDPVEIMSAEDIAAMLDRAAGGSAVVEDEVEGEDADAAADIEDEIEEEAVAEGDEEADSEGDNDLDDLFGRLDEAEAPPAGTDEDDNDTRMHLNGVEGLLTAEEVDILGEVGNISMGAVATTMYSLLDRRVSITTPHITVFDAKDVLSIYKIPFVVATIEYIEGITGNNLLVLKVDDAALITDLLMGGDGTLDDPVELNEMHLSAMSEIMNQMMGASSTSLSKLLRKAINISPPKSSQVDAGFDVTTVLGDIDKVTKISFDMEIEGLLKSELIQLMPYEVSREFAKRFMDIGMGMPSEDNDKKAPAAAPPPPPPPPTEQSAASVEAPPQPMEMPDVPPMQPNQAVAQYPQTPYQQGPYPQAYPQQGGRLVDVHPLQFQAFDAPAVPSGEVKGIDLVYNIPLQVTVELGKTRKEIAEILEFGTGTIIVLDKIAGDPVEIVVNGKLIARGEVVVIDENYGVRITDIING